GSFLSSGFYNVKANLVKHYTFFCLLLLFKSRYSPAMNPDWYNGKGYKIARPDCIGEKFELLANKFYPFFEEFFAV
ncbi:MAG: hypothetical protein V7K40_33445, partial [Nostoc sp.]|uniref:hypothetical protein n=1 Tax=Nostoc sp. TaxID=1180 RepID=UPI002FFBF27C